MGCLGPTQNIELANFCTRETIICRLENKVRPRNLNHFWNEKLAKDNNTSLSLESSSVCKFQPIINQLIIFAFVFRDLKYISLTLKYFDVKSTPLIPKLATIVSVTNISEIIV